MDEGQRDLSKRMDEGQRDLSKRMDESQRDLAENLSKRMDEGQRDLVASLSKRMDEGQRDLTERLDQAEARSNTQYREVLAELRSVSRKCDEAAKETNDRVLKVERRIDAVEELVVARLNETRDLVKEAETEQKSISHRIGLLEVQASNQGCGFNIEHVVDSVVKNSQTVALQCMENKFYELNQTTSKCGEVVDEVHKQVETLAHQLEEVVMEINSLKSLNS